MASTIIILASYGERLSFSTACLKRMAMPTVSFIGAPMLPLPWFIEALALSMSYSGYVQRLPRLMMGDAAPRLSSRCHVEYGMLWSSAKALSEMGASLLTYRFHAAPRISRCRSVRCSPSSRLMVYFFLLMASILRVPGRFGTSMIHDFPDAVGVFLLRRRPPP